MKKMVDLMTVSHCGGMQMIRRFHCAHGPSLCSLRVMSIGGLFLLFTLTAGAQSLDSLRNLLRENNPELRALAIDYRAALAISPQLSQLPDLEIGAGLSILPVETRLGPQRARVMVTQMLPWPGTLAAMAALADARAQPILEQAAARQLELIYLLEITYYSILTTEEQIAALEESLDLYGSLQRLAMARVENSRGSSVEVYRTEIQLTATRRRIEELRSEQAIAWTTIEELVTEELLRRAVPVNEPPVRVIPAQLPDDGHPLLRIFTLQEEVSWQAIALNELAGRPAFGIGVDYVVTGRRSDMDPAGNGRDAILPRVMVRVPLSGGQYRAKRDEERLRLQSIAVRRVSVTNQLDAALERADIARRDAAARRNYLQEQARTVDAALTIARSEYANSRRPFDEVIRLLDQLIEYRLQALEAQLTLYTQAAAVDRYLPQR